MTLADTSVVIDGMRSDDRFWAALWAFCPGANKWAIALPTRMEVLMGARGQNDRERLERHLERWELAPMRPGDWDAAARIYADLRQLGVTMGAMDCCIAQTAISHDALLLHRDRDFDRIVRIRPALRLARVPALL